MAHGLSVALDELHCFNANAHVGFGEGAGHAVVAFLCLDTFGHHGIVRHQQEGSRGYMVEEAAGEEGGRFHINRHGACLAQVCFEAFVVLPHAAVGRIDRARPVVFGVVAQGRGDGALEHEGGQRGHFGWEIVVAGSFTADAGQGQDVVAQMCLVGDAAALAQEEACFGTDGTEQVHYEGGVGAAHAEVDHSNVARRHCAHIGTEAYGLHARQLCEDVHVVIEIGQEDVLAKAAERHFGIARQPIVNDFLLFFHKFRNFVGLESARKDRPRHKVAVCVVTANIRK